MKLRKLNIKKNKKAEIPAFGWIFAMIIGAVILFIAIFVVVRVTSTQKYKTNTELAAKLDSVLNPFASVGSIGAIFTDTITLPSKTQINLVCEPSFLADDDSTNDLGAISLIISSEDELLNSIVKEAEAGQHKSYNKYIFGNSSMVGKELAIMSRPLELPFRVDDVIYITTKKYCFENTPDVIKQDISLEINEQRNPIFDNTKFYDIDKPETKCSTDEIRVCFGSCSMKSGNILVKDNSNGNYDIGTVTIQGQSQNQGKPFVTLPLMYAAIFSDDMNYYCNLKRLMSKTAILADIYVKKSDILSGQRSCAVQSVRTNLLTLKSQAEKIASNTGVDCSEKLKSKVYNCKKGDIDFNSFFQTIEAVRTTNKYASCTVY